MLPLLNVYNKHVRPPTKRFFPRLWFCFVLSNTRQVIKAISGKGAPACNCVALTGMTGEAKVFRAPRKA